MLKDLESEDRLFYSGLCGLSFHLNWNEKISDQEYDLMDDYLYDHSPRDFKWGGYWFTPGSIPPRKRWLKQQIKRLEKGKK